MASGNFLGNSPVSTNLYVTWSSTPNTTTNTSTVTVNLYMRHYKLYASALSGSYLSVGGNSSNYSKKISYSGSSQTDTLLTSKTVTVAHNADGSGTCNITGTFVLNGTLSGQSVGTITASKTVTLDKIARSSSIDKITNSSGTTISSINSGSDVRVYWTPAATSYKYRIQCSVSGSTYTFPSASTFYTPNSTSSYYTTITTAHSWVPSQSSDTVSVKLYTYNSSGTQIGDVKTSSFTLNVPVSIVPKINSFTATVVDGKNGNYVLGKSKVQLTVNATKGNGATNISSYTFTGPYVDGQNSSVVKKTTATSYNITSGILNETNVLYYTVFATDTRGRNSTPSQISITVLPYSPPSISSITVQRCNSEGVFDNNGTYAYITVNSSYSPLNGNNTRTVVLSSSLDNYADETIIQEASDTSTSYSVVYGGSFSVGSSYTIRAIITDTAYSNSTTKETTMSTAERPINFAKYGNGIAVGGMSSVTSQSEDGLFEVNWETNINANVSVGGDIYMGGLYGQNKEQTIRFSNPSDSTNPHDSALYGGNPNSKTDIGIWDALNNRGVFRYESSSDNGGGVLYIPMTSSISEVVYNSNSDNTETNLNTWLSNKLASMPQSSLMPCKVCCYPAISGTSYSGFLFKHDDNYAHLYGKDYFGETIYKPLKNGVWQNATKYSYDSINTRLTNLENRHVNEFSSISIDDLPNKPSGWSGYGRVIRWGSSSSSDKYYLLVDSNGGLYTGAALNGAATITWKAK